MQEPKDPKHQGPKPDTEPNQATLTDLGEKSDEAADGWDKWVDSRKHKPTEVEFKSPKPGWNSIKTIRKELGWVACELEDEGRGKAMTRRKTRRQRALARRLGKRRRRRKRRGMGRTLLYQIKENLRGLLQIGLLKERKRRESAARQKALERFRKQGPRSLRPRRGEKQGYMDIAGVDEIGRF